MKSFLDCKHVNVQSFTEYCLDCHHNIWTTPEEYYQELKDKAAKKKSGELFDKIRKLEKELDIGE